MYTVFTEKTRRTTILIAVLILVLAVHFLKIGETYGLWILISGTVVGVIPVFVSAARSLWSKEWASMDTLASLALIFSIIEGEWASAVFISLMLAAARLLNAATEERMERSVRSLMKLKPTTAKVKRDGTLEHVAIDDIRVGDTVVVDTGERVAIDGTVLSGQATVDESSLTGESLPVEKEEGSTVSSSTLLASGSLTVRATRIGKDTTLERIIALVESSRDKKPHIEGIGERFGKLYLVSIFIGAALILLFSGDTKLVLAVVLVVCADDVAIAIPLAYLRAIGTAAKHGIVIKGGKYLEVLGKVDTVVFDKTGTLTRGKPHVVRVVTEEGITENELLEAAYPAAKRSTHPLSLALLRHAETSTVRTREADSAEVVGGKGVVAVVSGTDIVIGNERFIRERGIRMSAALAAEAESCTREGKSVSYVARAGVLLGFAVLGDELKSGARESIDALRRSGVKHIVLLSGDNARTAGLLAEELGIKEWYAELLPEEKVTRIADLSTKGIVAMVGDGVNDAAALSRAHVGIAMGALGSDGAIESANIVLMHDNLDAIPKTIELAHSVRKISIQDFFIWGGSNALGLALVFAGLIGPSGAAAYNFISDFFPLLNSWRSRFPRATPEHPSISN